MSPPTRKAGAYATLDLVAIVLLTLVGAAWPFWEVTSGSPISKFGDSLVLLTTVGAACFVYGIQMAFRSMVQAHEARLNDRSEQSQPTPVRMTRGLLWMAVGLYLVTLQLAAFLLIFIPGG